jgi:uncharacterized protein (DUF427 family)
VALADTHRAKRVFETSHPPVYYIPLEDIKMEYLLLSSRTTFCEFKGQASYYTVSVNGKTIPKGAWYYSDPSKGFESIANYVAFYPAKVDGCFVNGLTRTFRESSSIGEE